MRRHGFFVQLALAVRFARRELRGGLAGFYIFLACIALGVAAIGGVGSASKALTGGLVERGRAILGGDLALTLSHRPIAQEERSFLAKYGAVSELASLRAMARTSDGSDQLLVEVKAVDGSYPTVGDFRLAGQAQPAKDLEPLFGGNDRLDGGVLVASLLLDRLGLEIGDQISIGTADVLITGAIGFEPDALATGVGFGPRVLMSLETLQKTDLVQPGSIVRYVTRLTLEGEGSQARLQSLQADLKEAFPDAGWRVQSRGNAAQGLSRNIERFAAFLVLVGLASLITGGVGIANAVRAFVVSRQSVIASYKCLGAPGRLVVLIYLVQITLIALLAIGIGLFFAMLVPFGLALALPDNLPIASQSVFPLELLKAAAFGLLTAWLFSMGPLLRARSIPATALFRDQVAPHMAKNRWQDWLLLGGLAALLVALVLSSAEVMRVAALFLVGMGLVFASLRLIAWLIMALARRLPRVKQVIPRLALGNLHRPGALTPSVSLSLGLGLSLLVTLVMIDMNLQQQLTGNLQEKAPNFFFINIQSHSMDDFETRLKDLAPEGDVQKVPMLRGRIVSLKGIAAADYNPPEEARWILRGDRGITYSHTAPKNSTLVEGQWWDKDYSGKPLVSFDEDSALELGLGLGDEVQVSVLGRMITAEIANLRRIEWESMGINFVMVFSPNAFAGAPHAFLSTLTLSEKSDGALADKEAQILKTISADYPTVTSVRVGDALDRVNDLVRQLAWGMRAASLLAVVASILVLAGALAAGQRERIYDAVILKTLGASRLQVLVAYSLEYALLGLVTAGFALLIGNGAAYLVLGQIMDLPFTAQPLVAILTVVIAILVTISLGLAGTLKSLSAKPARILRAG
ncbi:MAG: FtsX-like permease family protein [Cohaesibacter sp.]|nr:FtsX-like permease family protein [Cohaesibacter sp.]MCV6601487.1 FtsX-like permease family protein [Cohaesibacter sp.]